MRHDLFRFSGSHIPSAALLLLRSRSNPALTHTGIIYRDKNDKLKQIEFFSHGGIGASIWAGKLPHVVVDLGDDEDAIDYLVALCQVMEDRYRPSSPEHLYGFRRDKKAFVDPRTGQLYLGNGEASCASFVLIVLSSARIELVAEGADWPYRPHSDEPGYEAILEFLKQTGETPETIARVRLGFRCPRVSPPEIVGAAMCPHLVDRPATQEFSELAARWLLGLFDHNSAYNV